MIGAYGYTYTYNVENQLIRIDLSGVEVARYEYDSNGLRTRKITPVRTERYYDKDKGTQGQGDRYLVLSKLF